MRAVRWLAVIVIVGVLVAAAMVDRETRTFDVLATPLRPGVPVTAGGGATWYCPGGSSADGIAGAALEIVNAGEETALATVSVVDDGPGDIAEVVHQIDANDRSSILLAGLAPEAAWVGAVVEVSGTDVVVEQTYAGPSGSDRLPCSTRTGSTWLVPFGATRAVAEGEQMVLLLLNPFPDDAIVDLGFEADVGFDSVPPGFVVPAHRVVAVDVTEEVTVAARVSAVIEVTSGRLVASRIQTFDGPMARGLAVVSASPGSPIIHLPTVRRLEGRRDLVSVTNPTDEAAEVDLEILTDGDRSPDPVELTVLPGRTVQVDLAAEQRLAELDSFSLVVRSLSGTPVAASVDSVVMPGSADPEVVVVGAASSVGADVAATRWLVPVDGGDADQGSIVVVNPSPTAIATVEISSVDVDGTTLISSVELGPRRRAIVDIADVEGERPVVLVESSAPVVAGRETAGLTSRSMAIGVVAAEPVEFSALR